MWVSTKSTVTRGCWSPEWCSPWNRESIFRPTATAVDEVWRGMGIRIEDNVVVTRDDADILTSDICKTTTDIEELMAS